MGVKLRLGLMMFLQYAIWGAWAPVLSEYLENSLNFSGTQIGAIYALLPLATIISPFIGGQIADRYFASEKFIAILQITGGLLLVYISTISDYRSIMWLMLLYCILYAPTLALTNSVAFINLKKSEKEFGQIRVWGTIGWIVAGLLLTGWRFLAESHEALQISGDTLFLAGIFSLIMGFLAFSLPHTPPQKEGTKPWAFMEAIKMMKDKNVTVFIIISFVVATELMFYYVLTAPFLGSEKIGLSSASIPGVMVIAQVAEIFVMLLLLPYLISRIGIRKILVIGVLAWPVRYIIFAVGQPAWLVIASLALHGFCFVFFFVAAFIYMDLVSPRDIRHSAQSLIMIVTYGFGNFTGSLFAGKVMDHFASDGGINWTGVFLVPCALTVLAALALLLFFKDPRAAKPQESAENQQF